MSDNRNYIYEFSGFRLDTSQSVLTRNGELVKMPKKTFELLRFLVEHNNEVLDKGRLIESVWSDAFVEEANLSVHISHLRRILHEGDENGDGARIETFPKIGYRFSADVKQIEATSKAEPEKSHARFSRVGLAV